MHFIIIIIIKLAESSLFEVGLKMEWRHIYKHGSTALLHGLAWFVICYQFSLELKIRLDGPDQPTLHHKRHILDTNNGKVCLISQPRVKLN